MHMYKAITASALATVLVTQSMVAHGEDCTLSGSEFFDFANQLGSHVVAELKSDSGNCYPVNNSMIASSDSAAGTVCEFSLFGNLKLDEASSFDKFLYAGEGFTILEGPQRGGQALALKIRVEAKASTTRMVSITRVELNIEDCDNWKDAF